jgi:hypothetical protein
MIGMICAMGFRLVPVIEGTNCCAKARAVILGVTLGVCRNTELSADYLRASWERAVSALLGRAGCLGLAVSVTMLGNSSAG